MAEPVPEEAGGAGQADPGERSGADAGDNNQPSSEDQADADESQETAGDRESRKRERNDKQTQAETEGA